MGASIALVAALSGSCNIRSGPSLVRCAADGTGNAARTCGDRGGRHGSCGGDGGKIAGDKERLFDVFLAFAGGALREAQEAVDGAETIEVIAGVVAAFQARANVGVGEWHAQARAVIEQAQGHFVES